MFILTLIIVAVEWLFTSSLGQYLPVDAGVVSALFVPGILAQSKSHFVNYQLFILAIFNSLLIQQPLILVTVIWFTVFYLFIFVDKLKSYRFIAKSLSALLILVTSTTLYAEVNFDLLRLLLNTGFYALWVLVGYLVLKNRPLSSG